MRDASEIGVTLTRRAFNPDKGALTDHDSADVERKGVAHLSAGAISTFKNPTIHRHVTPRESAPADHRPASGNPTATNIC